MTNDVKALPVVAYGYANTRPTGERHSLAMVELDNSGDQYPELALPLVLKSDAESALAELRAEVGRLRTALDHVRLQAGAWKCEAVTQRATVLGVGNELGGVPDYGPIVQGVADLRQRADTAEARLERASGLLDLASQHVKSNARLADTIRAFLGEGK